MERLKHVWPSIEHKEDAIGYVKEHIDCNSHINGSGGLNKCVDDYEGWLKRKEEEVLIEPSEELVPAETYYLIREDDNKIVGMVNIRLCLNKKLDECGGHIGYGIRPSERRKGYNKINLYLALKRCHELGIDMVLLDCNIDNPGSYKSMEALGGTRIKEYSVPDRDGLIYRYSIDVVDSLNKYRKIYEEKIVKKL